MSDLSDIIKQSFHLKLLYVEDDADARESILSILEIFFKDIIVGVDGQDGLDKFKSNEVDMVITDINMPKMDGLKMSKEIKSINSEMPIFIFSAYSDISYFIDAIKIGIEGYLLKPLEMGQFTKELKRCVQNIHIKAEHKAYKKNLEERVQKQVQLLREKDKILLQQSKMASMGEMIDAVAHQWKQPLNIISLNTSYMSELAEDEEQISKEDILTCDLKVQQQIKHLTTTLDEFRKFLRPNSNLVKIDIKELVTSTLLILKDELVKYNINVNTMPKDNFFISANENDIKHLIINLINNAKDEMLKKEIEDKQITITYEYDDENSIVLSVKDSGNGIPLEIIDNIFTANFTTKKDEGGTGIGLYMCRLIADKYQAKIEAFNDNGAVFKTTFPTPKDEIVNA